MRKGAPVAVFTIFGAASIAVLDGNHHRTMDALNGAVAAVDNLTQARLAATQAYLASEQADSGDPTFSPTRAVADLARAADLVDDLRGGRTSLLVIHGGTPLSDDALVAASQRYSGAIANLQDRLRAGNLVTAAARRSAFMEVQSTAAHLEHQLYASLRERLVSENRRHGLWLGGWSGFLVFTAMGLVMLGRGRRLSDQAREIAERSLARSEAHFRSLIEHAPDVIFLLDRDGVIRYESPSTERALGYAPGELIGRSYFDGVHADDRPALQRLIDELVDEPGGSRSAGYRYRRKQGEWRLLESTATSLLHDPAVDAIVVNTNDVTERIRTLDELRESEKRTATLLKAIPDLIFRLTREGEFIDFQAPDGTGDLYVPAEQIRGSSIRDLLPPNLAEQTLQEAERALASADVQRFEYSLPVAGRTDSFEARLVPSGPDEVLVLVRNVTEQRRAQERERELLREQAIRAEAEAASEAKNSFLSRMSHELRTPLNAILGFGQLLELEATTTDDRESVEQILKAGKYLLALIDEVLDISRIEAGELRLSVEPVSVRRAVDECVELVRVMAARRGITIHARPALARGGSVLADKQRLTQVLLNLLSNAIKYNRDGGTVTVSCEEAGQDRLRIWVRDTGRGIDATKLQRLFTPFDRLGADQTDVEGTGLGLALSKRLIESMGGTIGVESVEGEGSLFSLELPVAAERAADEPADEHDPWGAGAKADVGATGHTVLFVEDNLANVRLVERLFQRYPSARLLTAMQGRLGLQLAKEHHPDLILLDLDLPDLPGDEVLREIRRDPNLGETPVVMISGDAIPSQVQRLLDLGATGYITKPFDIHQFLKLVENSLVKEQI